MKLRYQKDIDKIENCPSDNEKGNKELYRFILSNSIDENSFVPNSTIFKPKFDKICIAWGLSTYDSLNNAEEALRNLPKKTREKFKAIAVGDISDKDGIKYLTKSKGHYTLFPFKDVNLLSKFELVEKND